MENKNGNAEDDGKEDHVEGRRIVDSNSSGDLADNEDDNDDAANDDDQPDDDDDDSDEDGSEGEEDNPLAHLPDYVLERVNKLKDLDAEREKIMETYLAERAALEKKFASLFDPLYTARAEIVRGDKDNDTAATADTAAADSASSSTIPVVAVNGGVADPEPRVKGIPHFWVTAMSNSETIAELITETDVDCLEHLENVTCVDRNDGKGFQLHFFFAPNEYFENTVLTKTYQVPNLLLSDEPLLKSVKGTPVTWKPDRALTYRMVKKKQRGKGKHAGHVRTVEKKEEIESFFKWFEPPEMPPMDEMDEEKADEFEEIFDADYVVAQAFRNYVIPRAVLWYTGEDPDEQMAEAALEDAEE